MPIYEYTCQDCEAQFEKFVRSMAAQAEVVCPECGGSHVKKGWSVFGSSNSTSGMGLGASSAANCAPTGT
jgi:putative FmdB family regulatory protein